VSVRVVYHAAPVARVAVFVPLQNNLESTTQGTLGVSIVLFFNFLRPLFPSLHEPCMQVM